MLVTCCGRVRVRGGGVRRGVGVVSCVAWPLPLPSPFIVSSRALHCDAVILLGIGTEVAVVLRSCGEAAGHMQKHDELCVSCAL